MFTERDRAEIWLLKVGAKEATIILPETKQTTKNPIPPIPSGNFLVTYLNCFGLRYNCYIGAQHRVNMSRYNYHSQQVEVCIGSPHLSDQEAIIYPTNDLVTCML